MLGRSFASISWVFLGKIQTLSLDEGASLLSNKILGEVFVSEEGSVSINFSSSLVADFEEPKHWECWMAISSLQIIKTKQTQTS